MASKRKLDLEKYRGIKLDIGCGNNKTEGFIGIDYHQYGNVDIVHDIEKTPWPLEDDSVLVATCSHVLEHINPHGGVFVNVLNEIWRVLKPGCQIAFVVPYAGSPGFWQDPTHCNGISEVTMCYFDPLHESGLYEFYEPAPWEIQMLHYKPEGNLDCVLKKRDDDRSYHKDDKIHWGPKKGQRL